MGIVQSHSFPTLRSVVAGDGKMEGERMKIVSELLMLAPTVTLVTLFLSVRRFGTVEKYLLAIVFGLLASFVLMFIGIYMRLNP